MDIIKAKEKRVMTKKELILYGVKRYIVQMFILVLFIFFIRALAKDQENMQQGGFLSLIVFIVAFIMAVSPGIPLYLRWKRWDKHFPKTVYFNPTSRIANNLEHYDKTQELFQHVVDLDKMYENRLNISEENKKYVKYLMDSYYGKEWIDDMDGTYNEEYK